MFVERITQRANRADAIRAVNGGAKRRKIEHTTSTASRTGGKRRG